MHCSTRAIRAGPSLLQQYHAVPFAARRRYHKIFAESDLAILRPKSDPSAQPIIVKPLSPAVKIQTHKGVLSHADIIGKRPRDVVKSSSGAEFRIHDVSLGEYIRFSRRLVTPVSVPNLNLALQTKQLLIPFQIYPADANLIVSLFDFHVSPPRSSGPPAPEERLEILEAGTGHGALTLHLSRAIHAANAAKPDVAPVESETPDAAAAEGGDEGYASGSETAEDEWSMWRSSRTAVIHTIDVSAKFSQHAAKIVRGFRHGIYADNVDFHVGNVSGWVQAELARRAETNSRQGNPSPSPFLTHAFLDLPATANHLATVASAMYTDGTLIVFNPSITQVAECLQRIRQDGLPLYLEQVVELGTNATSGGREWDVRAVRPRAALREEELAKIRESGMGGEEVTRDGEQVSAESGNRQAEWSLVCRPKVGERIVGGGFLGVFKKTRNTTDPVAQDTAA